MDKPASNLEFRFMSLGFLFRDLRLRRMEILKEVGIQSGFLVLDFGCGAGSYVAATSRLVGQSGRVYALDIHPLAIRSVANMVSKKGLTNVETVLSDCSTGLPDESIDAVLLYDTFHGLSQPATVLQELHRVSKPHVILSFSDHHMKEAEIPARVAEGGLFKLEGKGRRTHRFSKVNQY
jgi:ubiquinone/menaquinone biosynthesis C-methylase UbiE